MASMLLNIREATQKDIPDMMAIEESSFSDAWSAQVMRECLESRDTSVLIADESGWVVGYIILSVSLDEAEIHNIAVAGVSRRRGIGKALMERAIRKLAFLGVHSVFLEVRESNTAAISLYESFGFKQISTRKRYYDNPAEDAIIMKLEGVLI